MLICLSRSSVYHFLDYITGIDTAKGAVLPLKEEQRLFTHPASILFQSIMEIYSKSFEIFGEPEKIYTRQPFLPRKRYTFCVVIGMFKFF